MSIATLSMQFSKIQTSLCIFGFIVEEPIQTPSKWQATLPTIFLHSRNCESLLGRRDIGDALVALIDPEVRAQRQALALENVAMRDKALIIASDIYHVEMRRTGNERVGMRAMGAAKDRIRDVSLTLRSQEYQHELLSALEALKERHLDIDGEHEHARSCIDQLFGKLR